MSLEFEDEATLRAKLSAMGTSYGEKKSILDARDKLSRLHQERPTNLADAITLTGTCLDMCPEFERYFRIETKQVSPFEMDYSQDQAGTPDETIMVKEYRRAGADQKEPLPHELRPIEVLTRTMHYLCLKIINQYDSYGNLGEWFDFIWSRTRSLRKDITQQRIVTLESVALIEQCARFHIFCSFFLCEEETHNFDHKINDENLSNCLQTLKDLYYDLTNRSIHCANESEFRAYDILISLCKGEALSELTHFNANIRNSSQVKFAIAIYQTFATHNYIKFFKFVRKADFFQSCILNRYFDQLRCEALRVLSRAYTNKSSPTASYSTPEFMRHFAFDDFSDFSSFCDRMGLKYDQEFLELQRLSFSLPMYTYKLTRPKMLVWTKLHTTPGQAIIGGVALSEEDLVMPVHASFDDEGRLLFDELKFSTPSKPLAEKGFENTFARQTTSTFFDNKLPIFNSTNFGSDSNSFFKPSNIETTNKPTFNFKVPSISFAAPVVNPPLSNNLFSTVPDVPKQSQPPEAPSIDKKALINELCEDIYQDTLDEIIKEAVNDEFNKAKERNRLATEMSLSYYDQMLTEHIQQMAKEVLDAEKARKVWVAKTATDIMDNMVNNIIASVVKDTYQAVKAQSDQIRIAKMTEALYNDIFNSILEDFVQDQLKAEQRQHQEKIRQYRAHLLRRKYFNKWKIFYNNGKKYRYYRDTLPAISATRDGPRSTTTTIACQRKGGHIRSMFGGSIIDDQYARHEQFYQRALTKLSLQNGPKVSKENGHNGIGNGVHHCDSVSKYFYRWLEATRRKRKRMSNMKSILPAAPSLQLYKTPTRDPAVFRVHSTLIDANIEQANQTFKHFMSQRLNNDYQTTVDSARRKLAMRRAKEADIDRETPTTPKHRKTIF